jgi:hypothetical protein
VNPLLAEQAERRRLEQEFLNWRLGRLGLQRRRRGKDAAPAEGGRHWSWDQLTNRAPPPSPVAASRPREVKSFTLPQPMDGWEIS